MKITEITASVGQTIQLAPYEPFNAHVSYKAELIEGEDPHKCMAELHEKAKKDLRKQINDVKIKKAAKAAKVSESAMNNAEDLMVHPDEGRYEKDSLKDNKGNHFF